MTDQVICKMTDWHFEDDRPPYDTYPLPLRHLTFDILVQYSIKL